MFLVFGTGEKERQANVFYSVVCPNCGRYTQAELIDRFTYLHVFFIPTFRWDHRYYVRLRCCGAAYRPSDQQVYVLKENGTVDFSTMKRISGGYASFSGAARVTCTHCGGAFDANYPFCPYCGEKKSNYN